MTPRIWTVGLLLAAAATPACVKHSPRPARVHATPTPSPFTDEGGDASAERMRRKTAEAAVAINDYLKENQPKLREKFQAFGDKFARDKDAWRKKLLAKRKELQPRIDALKQKATQVNARAKMELDKQTASLEQEREGTDKKLAELESATTDGWKAFKEKLKAEQAAPTPTPTPAETPAPSS